MQHQLSSVLFISDTFTGGGLETRITEQIQAYKSSGIKVYLAAIKFNPKLIDIFDDVFQLKNPKSLLDATRQIESICKKQKIDYIDINPVNFFISSVIVANKMHIPSSYTIHGRYGLPTSKPGTLKNIINYIIISSPNLLPISVSDLLAESVSVNNSIIIPNGILKTYQSPVIKPVNNKIWCLASRLDYEKSEYIKTIIENFHKLSISRLDIYGDGEAMDMLEDLIIKNNLSNKIYLKGWTSDLVETLKTGNYNGVIGMGRVALESASVGLPVIILGYHGAIDVLDKSNHKLLAKTNFTSREKYPLTNLIGAINKIYENPKKFIISDIIHKYYNSKNLWQQHLARIKKQKHINDPILTSLYDYIISNSKNDLIDIDYRIESLVHENKSLKKALDDIYSSRFWRLTTPIRKILSFFHR